MADSLEIKRVKAELARVIAGKMELELRIEERLDEINRIKTSIEVQEAKEKELTEKLAQMNS